MRLLEKSVLAALLCMLHGATWTAQAEISKPKEVREPAAQELSMDLCSQKSNEDLAREALKFIASGGVEEKGSACLGELGVSLFRAIEIHESDILPRKVRIDNEDAVKIQSVTQIKDEFDFDTNVFDVKFEIVSQELKIVGGFSFSRSTNDEDIKLYGCGYLRRLPEPAFIKRICEKK